MLSASFRTEFNQQAFGARNRKEAVRAPATPSLLVLRVSTVPGFLANWIGQEGRLQAMSSTELQEHTSKAGRNINTCTSTSIAGEKCPLAGRLQVSFFFFFFF